MLEDCDRAIGFNIDYFNVYVKKVDAMIKLKLFSQVKEFLNSDIIK